jgi:hypothetical protein
MRWVTASGCGVATYFLIGAVSAAEPILVRGAWGIVAAVAVLLVASAYRR